MSDRYLDAEGARKVLAELGIDLNERQIRRTKEPRLDGKPALPWFRDPITKKLLISEAHLRTMYARAASQAHRRVVGG